jgi:chloride channel protein, CIC family
LILDSVGQLAGILTQGDMARALRADPSGNMTVLNAGNQSPVVTYPDELVHDAVVKMLQHDVSRLPVVARDDPRRIVGYFGRSSVLTALLRQIESEKVREPGWLAGFRGKRGKARRKIAIATKTTDRHREVGSGRLQ